MSLWVHVEGEREDVERFFNEILEPEFGETIYFVSRTTTNVIEIETKRTQRSREGFSDIVLFNVGKISRLFSTSTESRRESRRSSDETLKE